MALQVLNGRGDAVGQASGQLGAGQARPENEFSWPARQDVALNGQDCQTARVAQEGDEGPDVLRFLEVGNEQRITQEPIGEFHRQQALD